MRKEISLALFAVLVVVAGVVAMSAWEAHVVNVTAHIENALRISSPVSGKLDFGTVFPQEYLEKSIWITTSESFCSSTQTRVESIDYKIVQKPKPIWPQTLACEESIQHKFADLDEARAYCHAHPENLDCCYPSLCAYLSKTPKYLDSPPYTDYGVPAFHNPNATSSVATGVINKYHDLVDEWVIDLTVPCFEGMCAQEWKHPGWELPAELENSDFGCDLWVEVTNIY